MPRNRRLFISVLALALLLIMVFAPLASAWGNGHGRGPERLTRQWGFMWVPRNTPVTYRLQVGQVRLVVPPGALPKGGPIFVWVVSNSAGQFTADFLPSRQFRTPVIMGFGNADVVYYHQNGRNLLPIPTGDVTGDGQGGEILSEHFSRYSGWF